jgi:hypothetical protein
MSSGIEENKKRVSMKKFEAACLAGNTNKVLRCLQFGTPDVNVGMKLACRGGHLELVKLLIDRGANEFQHGLACACRGVGNLQVVKLMLEKMSGAPLEVWWHRTYFDIAMEEASRQGHLEIVQLLFGMDLHSKGRDDFGHTCLDACLFRACRKGHVHVARLLISYGATAFQCAFDHAFISGRLGTLQLMIDKGVKNGRYLSLGHDIMELSEAKRSAIYQLLVKNGDRSNVATILDIDPILLPLDFVIELYHLKHFGGRSIHFLDNQPRADEYGAWRSQTSEILQLYTCKDIISVIMRYA